MPRPPRKPRRPFLRLTTPFRGFGTKADRQGASTTTLPPIDADLSLPPTSKGKGPATKELPPKLTGKGDGTPTDRNMVDSERPAGSESERGTAPELDERQKAVVGLMDDRFMASWQSRLPKDKQYLESLAHYNGDQWVDYDYTLGALRDVRDTSRPGRVWAVNNKLRPIVFHLMARAIANDSDAVYRPLTGRTTDRLATRQMRSVWADVKENNDYEALMNRLRMQSIVVGPAYAYTYYDTRTVVPVPVLEDKDEAENPNDPQIKDIVDRELGEIKIGFVSTFELYLDPKARHWDDMSWVIHAKRVDIEHIKARWPEEGQWVQPEQSGNPGEIVSVQLDAVTGNQNSRMFPTGKHTAILKTLWERPSPAYKKGRYIVVAGGRILEEREWLYPKITAFPFVRFVYRDGIETAWGDNAIYPVLGAQRSYNRALSKIQERVKAGDGKLLVAKGSEVSKTAFRSEARDEYIEYLHADPRNPASLFPEPKYVPHPPLDPVITESLQLNDGDMKQITSVNDPSLGQTRQDLSGVSINALQDADQSEGTIQRDNEQRFVRELAANVGALARQFYIKDESRLIFMQDSAPSRKPVLPVPGGDGDGGPMNGMQGAPVPTPAPPGGPGGLAGGNAAAQPPPNPIKDAQDDPMDSPRMEAVTFTHLSQGRWTVDATAAAAMSPSARRSFLMTLMQAGAFKPDQLPATIVLLQEMELLGGDSVLTDDLLRALQMVERMNQAAPAPDPEQAAHLKAASESIIAGAIQSVKTQGEIEKIKAQAEADIAKMQAEHALPPKVTLAGKLSPAGEVAAEEQAGLDIHGAASHLLQAGDAHPGGQAPYGVAPPPTMAPQTGQPGAQGQPGAAGAPSAPPGQDSGQ